MPALKNGSHQANPEGRMPLIEHIRELRNRLLKVAIALALGAILAAIFFEAHSFTFFGTTIRTPGIWDFFRRPFCELQLEVVNALPQQGNTEGCGLVVNGIFEGFMLRIRLALILGLLLSSPVWIYQLWGFVAPGLHNNERRYTYAFLAGSVPLFLGGATLAYFTMTKGLAILIGFVPAGATPLIRISEYLTYVTVLVLVFGFSFLLPLLVTVLNLAGVLSYDRLKRWRRYIAFGVCIFAAVATPSQDPFTMLVLAVPMVVLMEIATLIAKFSDRRKARREEASAYHQLDDDETSPLDLDDSHSGDHEAR